MALSRYSHLQRYRGDSLMVAMFIFNGLASLTSSKFDPYLVNMTMLLKHLS